ncbi:MAG: short-chain fatty acyl-CoA regulator family protein [Pseudomonadota bacterium]
MARSIVGPRIREARRAQGLTQAELARKVGISASYLNLIERNRRGIAGKRLSDIAGALGLSMTELDGKAEQRLANELAGVAADPRLDGLGVEGESTADLIGRFPGWAKALGAIARSEREQMALVRALTDRLTHDPFLGESVHRMLTRIAAVRSTAEILDAVPDISPEQARRFHAILLDEGRQLSDTAEALAAYFDRAATPERAVTPEDEVQALFDDAANRFPALEMALEGADPAVSERAAHALAEMRAGPVIDRLIDEADGIATEPARIRARAALHRYAMDAARAPLARFHATAQTAGYDLERLVAETGLPQDLVCRRLTTLPKGESPAFGYVSANAAGSLLDLRTVRGFSPIRHAQLCPLWALARAQSAPDRALCQLVAMPDGRRYVFLARCRSVGPTGFGVPRYLETDMLVLSEDDAPGTVYGRVDGGADAEEVGVTCRLCPRKGCEHRVDDPLVGIQPDATSGPGIGGDRRIRIV